MLPVGGDACGQTFRLALSGGLVLVELLDEASSLDHTPVELLIESKFLVGSAVCLLPMILAFLHGEGGVLFAPPRFNSLPGFRARQPLVDSNWVRVTGVDLPIPQGATEVPPVPARSTHWERLVCVPTGPPVGPAKSLP